jgi:serine/threonine protein kinase
MSKRSAGGASAPAPKRAAGVSARAARTGAGGWDLSEAAGDLDLDYATLGVLGRGSFAEINLVRHRGSGELYALKFCCKLDAPSYTHLRAEATLAKKVRSPFVLSPLAISDSPGRAGNYSVLLPLCPGGDLLQLLRRQPTANVLDERAARSYAAMVVLGLRALHAAGLAYRDLKPENLLLRSDGYLCLADFGLAATAAQCKKKGELVGTAMYQAPELLAKAPHDVAVDWWALGCLLLEMVRGKSPFLRDDDEATAAAVLAHEGGVPAAQGEGAPEPSAALSDLCAKLLHPTPSERLGSPAGAAGADAIQQHAWFAELDWAACAARELPAPAVPAPLDAADVDATLLELSKRCQQGFDF